MAQVGEVPSNASEFATPSDPTTAWSHKWIPLPPGTDDDSSHPGDQKEHIVAESGELARGQVVRRAASREATRRVAEPFTQS